MTDPADTTPALTAEDAEALRRPFEPNQIGKLPRVTCKDCSDRRCQRHQKSKCDACRNFISTAHIHLDFVGHAAVTDRLLKVDPFWSWEPVAYDADGGPLVRVNGKEAELWIRLTIKGVTRLGIGTAATGSFELGKQLISDAIRNAAMRFGVALDLWAKENLVEFAQAARGGSPAAAGEATRQGAPADPPPEDPWQGAIDAKEAAESPLLDTKGRLARAMFAELGKAGIPEEERLEQTGLIIGRTITSSKEMTDAEAQAVIDHLTALRRGTQPEATP